jgi:hypothetical protein
MKRLLLLTILLWSASHAAAQSGNMGQGEASIAVRSDVKLSVKGTGGTTSERLAKLGQAVSDQMGDIRGCYRKQVSSAPEVIGKLRLKVALEKDKKTAAVELLDQADSTGPLVSCVVQVLTRGKFTDVGRPAAALVSLEFDNSRARGQAQMEKGAANLAQPDVQLTASGDRTASWSTEGNEVRFSVEASASAPPRAVELVLQGFKRGYAAFLDCRRKCEQGGVSPEGDIAADLDIDAKGRMKVKLGAITVAHKRASGCSDKAFKRVPLDKPASPFTAHVQVHFAP